MKELMSEKMVRAINSVFASIGMSMCLYRHSHLHKLHSFMG